MHEVLASLLKVCPDLLRIDGVEDIVEQRNNVLLELRLLKLLVPCPRHGGHLGDLVGIEERHLGWRSGNGSKKGGTFFNFLWRSLCEGQEGRDQGKNIGLLHVAKGCGECKSPHLFKHPHEAVQLNTWALLQILGCGRPDNTRPSIRKRELEVDLVVHDRLML